MKRHSCAVETSEYDSIDCSVDPIVVTHSSSYSSGDTPDLEVMRLAKDLKRLRISKAPAMYRLQREMEVDWLSDVEIDGGGSKALFSSGFRVLCMSFNCAGQFADFAVSGSTDSRLEGDDEVASLPMSESDGVDIHLEVRLQCPKRYPHEPPKAIVLTPGVREKLDLPWTEGSTYPSSFQEVNLPCLRKTVGASPGQNVPGWNPTLALTDVLREFCEALSAGFEATAKRGA